MSIDPEAAVKTITENMEFEKKISKVLEELPLQRHGMILSSLLVQVALKLNMTYEELARIIKDIYNYGKCGSC